MNPWPTQSRPWIAPAEVGRCEYDGRPRVAGRFVCQQHAEKIERTSELLRRHGTDWMAYTPPRGRRARRERAAT